MGRKGRKELSLDCVSLHEEVERCESIVQLTCQAYFKATEYTDSRQCPEVMQLTVHVTMLYTKTVNCCSDYLQVTDG